MSPRSNSKILLVDDEAELREIIKEDLMAKGHEVLEASGGHRAIEIFDSEADIDLVITDVMMDDGTGLELLDHVKSKNVERPSVVLLSAFADIEVEEAYDRGAEAFFPKPFNRKALLETVDRLLEPISEKWRRKSGRIDIDQHIELGVSVPDFTAAATRASVLNIGRGGMFLAWGDEMPEPGELVSFKISFLKADSIEFTGKGIVRWVRLERDASNSLPGIGLEFTELEGEHYSNFIDVLNFIQTKAFIPKH